MDVLGKSWDASVYDGIRQFQECKGFDPYSQEVTVELGYPHFQVSGDQHTTLAHLRQPDNHDCCSDSDEISYTEALSESGHEQYDLPSERGDAITIQNAQINLSPALKSKTTLWRTLPRPMLATLQFPKYPVYIPSNECIFLFLSPYSQCRVVPNAAVVKKWNCLPHPPLILS
ncbi:hypothetical protein B0H13DRAFT_1068112 [Mycena leptocephala]|nr:hypothetical protein B0H13DRAFT_1068112 [Mycena leptocephala]